jgi:cobalt-zinc-cadmium resistance protein CzcA
MIDGLIAFCLRKRMTVFIVAVLLSIYGYFAWKQLAVEAYPDLGDVSAQVTTQVPGLAAEEIEQQITIPLERALNGVPGLATIRSSSTFGLSLITMVFNDGIEDYWARQRITERINDVSLPSGAQPGLDPVMGPTGEIYRYTLESDTKNLMELSEIQRWIIIPALQQVPGVTNIDNFGGFTKQYEIEIDPSALQRYGVGLNDIVTAINNNNANGGGSRLTHGEQSFVIRGVGLATTLEDIENIVVNQTDSMPVLVRDLGIVRYGHKEREGILGKDGNPDSIQGVIDLLKYQNPSKVLAGVHAKVDDLNKQLAAEDVRIVAYIDRDDLVQSTVTKVAHTIIEGIGLVFIVLILFLGSPRSAMVVAVTVPIALVAVFILMQLTKMPANLFSLGAIDFGIIVDGAIVVMEAILRRRESKPTQVLTLTDVREAARQVAKPILFATLIIITAYFPLFAFERAEAKLISPMAITVGYALFGALLCTLTLIPGLAYVALRRPRPTFQNRPLKWLEGRYRATLSALLGRPIIAYATAGAVLVAVVGLFLTIGREFLPDLDEGALWLQVQMPTGLSLEQASEMAGELRRAVREFPEVSYIVTQLGRCDDGTDPWTPSHMEVPVGLTPYDSWPKGETKEQFLNRLTARLERLPGISVGISQPIIDMVNDVVGGAHSPLAIRIFGNDFNELRQIGGQIVDVLNGVQGTAQASIFQEPPIPQVVIKIDRDAVSRYGLNVSDVTGLIQTAVGGMPVSQVYVGDHQYDVTVKFPQQARNNPEALGKLFMTTSSGAQILLSQVASIKMQSGESTITHERNHRNLTVRIDLRGRDLASYLEEIQTKIARSVHFDQGKYRLEYAGQFENQRRAQSRLQFILGLVLAMMLVLLFTGLGTFRQALLTLGTVPLAALGGLIALHVTGNTLNVASAVGFIALSGVAVQNGIIMVANLNRVREEDVGSLHDAVLAGATERLRPVLMTATVATLGMLPAALATGIGSDVQRNLATVVVGGLVVATFLTLFVLPTLYFAIERRVDVSVGNRQIDETSVQPGE